jgi:hypothetical protein
LQVSLDHLLITPPSHRDHLQVRGFVVGLIGYGIYKCDNSANGKFVKIYLKILEYFRYSDSTVRLSFFEIQESSIVSRSTLAKPRRRVWLGQGERRQKTEGGHPLKGPLDTGNQEV